MIFSYEVHYSDALSRSDLVTLGQRGKQLCKKRFNKIVENPLDVLHPLIPFNKRPSKNLTNSRTYYLRQEPTCSDTFINKCAIIFAFVYHGLKWNTHISKISTLRFHKRNLRVDLPTAATYFHGHSFIQISTSTTSHRLSFYP